jgi:hypothetical protein
VTFWHTPLPLPSSSLPSSLLAAPPAMNRLASTATTIPGSITPLPRGPTSERTDFPFTRSASSTWFIYLAQLLLYLAGLTSKRADFPFTCPASSSQVRHSPPTHPRSFNASPPCRQQLPSASTPPPPARGTGVPPPTAPRALRQYMSSNRPTPITPTAITSSSYPSTNSGTSTIPTSSTTITTTTGGRFPPYIPQDLLRVGIK